MFTAALITIAKTWKQPICPLTDKQIKKLRYTNIMEYYSVIKMNAFESMLMRWMKLETIIQSKVSQKEKNKYHILMHIYGIYKDGTDEPESAGQQYRCRHTEQTYRHRLQRKERVR